MVTTGPETASEPPSPPQPPSPPAPDSSAPTAAAASTTTRRFPQGAAGLGSWANVHLAHAPRSAETVNWQGGLRLVNDDSVPMSGPSWTNGGSHSPK